jgi:cysteine desulfurase
MKQKSPEAALHIDATQSYMKLPFTKSTTGADMITISSHKIEGPKGVGALVIDKDIIKKRGITPLVLGGGQEGGLRSGTENVPGIAAFGEAIRLAMSSLRQRFAMTNSLREYLIKQIESDSDLSEISITNPKSHAPHILNITLPDIKSETMLHFLSSYGIYVSSGSACSSNSSHVSSALIAFGRSEGEADCSIRISLSHRNTKEDVDKFIEVIKIGLSKLSRKK